MACSSLRPKAETALPSSNQTGGGLRAAIIMLAIVLLWLTEPFHGVDAAWVALGGVAAMFAAGVLSAADIKAVNMGLLLFLVTVSAIGTVLGDSGISTLMFARLSSLLPQSSIYVYLLSMAVITMTLHMFIGSCVATFSVVLPSLISVSAGVVNPLVVTLLCYIVVNTHYVFPFHHVTMMVGSANRIFSDKLVLRFGLVLTIVILACLLAFYLPWWQLMGLI